MSSATKTFTATDVAQLGFDCVLSNGNQYVYKATHKESKKEYVVKLFNHIQNGTNKKELSRRFLNEACFADLESHKNLATPVHYVPNQTFKRGAEGAKKGYSMIISEYASNFSVFDWVNEFGVQFSERLARTYFRQLISGLSHMHEHGCAHLDIKPENLLFDEKFQLKIADFDLSYGNPETFVAGRGTKNYRSP